MIESFHVQGFRCLKDVRLELTPLHALIGPNDSGKSTLLQALSGALRDELSGARYTLRVDGDGNGRLEGQQTRVMGRGERVDGSFEGKLGSRELRIKPDEARRAHELMTSPWLGDDGFGLGALYDFILSDDRDAFQQIEEGVRGAFPTVDRLWLPVMTKGEKSIGVTLRDGTKVRPEGLSEGMLYWLVYQALEHLDPVDLLLVEEPENGLHPTRIAEVMGILRRLSEAGTQVVLATHSPLVINELAPGEVSVVSRTPEEGTRVRLASSIPDIEQMLSAFQLGEFWVTYADGVLDDELFRMPLVADG